MKYIFSTEGLAALAALKPTQTLYGFDFDGTLCDLQPNIHDSALTDNTLRLLNALSQRAKIAIISGRGLIDLQNRANFESAILVGNHGLEGVESAEPEMLARVETCARWVEQLRGFLHTEGMDVLVEDKKYSLSLHYSQDRLGAEKTRALHAFMDKVAPAPRLILGKSVINLVPQGSMDKGKALIKLMELQKLTQALFIGDDITDEDVFRLKDPRILSISVGENPNSEADYFLQHQNEIDRLLEHLVGAP